MLRGMYSMNDKKLTVKEIVKALECCISGIPCYKTKCPFKIKEICGDDIKALEKYALDLINRLQAENERLKKDKENLAYSFANAVGQKMTAKAENERLKKDNEHCLEDYILLPLRLPHLSYHQQKSCLRFLCANHHLT